MQPKDALLTALAALTTTADKLAYFTGSDTVDQTTLTSFARTVLAGADAAAILSTLGAPNLGRTGTGGAPSFRNKIIDGRFDFWYESTSKTYTGTSGYGAETMLFTTTVNDTVVVSQQAVALGEIPSAPSIQYWSKNVVTSVANAASYAVKKFKIEDVRTLAGKTVTFSFYAKADAVRNVAIEFIQVAGTGGSGSVNGLSPTIVTLSTTATRYSVTATLPSINSMTIGTGSDIEVNIWMDAGTNSASRNASLGQQSGTFYFTGVQLEEGSVATPFEELPYGISKSLVSRYYERSYNDSDATGTTTVSGSIQIQSPTPGTAGLLTHAFFKVAKRVSPAVTVYSSEGTVNTTSTSAGQLTADIQNIGCLGFTSGYNSGSSVCYLRFHFVADARL